MCFQVFPLAMLYTVLGLTPNRFAMFLRTSPLAAAMKIAATCRSLKTRLAVAAAQGWHLPDIFVL